MSSFRSCRNFTAAQCWECAWDTHAVCLMACLTVSCIYLLAFCFQIFKIPDFVRIVRGSSHFFLLLFDPNFIVCVTQSHNGNGHVCMFFTANLATLSFINTWLIYIDPSVFNKTWNTILINAQL